MDGRIATNAMMTHGNIGPGPLDLRLLDWLYRQIVTPRRIVRALVWTLERSRRAYVRPREFLAVWLSRPVGFIAYREREELCDGCPELDVVTDAWPSWRNGRFCRACRGLRWPLARLDRTNRRSRHRCPENRHPGVHPEYAT